MKIGIDARMLGRSGIGVYVERLIEGLGRLGRRHRFVLFTGGTGRIVPPREMEIRPVQAGIYDLSEQLLLPGIMRREGCDLTHIPHYNLPLRLGAPAVVTVHDLIHILFPQVMSGGIAAFYARWLMGQAVRRARIVIADSENTRGDLVRQFGVPLNKVRVIWLGVERRFRPVSRRSVRGFLGRWGIKAPYLLYVGQCRPHKNLARLVRAFALYRDAHPGPLKLVLRTVRDPRYAELHREIEVRGLRDSVLFLEDPIASADLPLLYGGAEAFVFPSLYEGFGLPPLEAMACGIPVVASRAASLPEVVGDAALLVDPRKERDMAEAIHQAVADRRVRAGLIARGMRRARLFDWDETVRRTLKVYEEAVRL